MGQVQQSVQHPPIFLECRFLDERSEKNNSCAAREYEGRCKPSPLGVKKQSPRKLWLFCILKSSKHRSLSSKTTKGDETLHQKSINTFESLGVLAWDPKPLYCLQSKIALNTDVPIPQ